MSRQGERVATLGEVREMIERHRQQWEHIESAEQALRALLAEVDETIEASRNAWAEGVRTG